MKEQRIIDITMSLKEPMRGFSKSVAKTIAKDGWNASNLEIYSHAGTHMDAPLHFDVSETTIDQIDVERFICQCHIIRLKDVQPSELITIDHIGDCADLIKPGEGVLFHTGWSKHHENMEIYRNQLPRISSDLAKWLAQRKINLIGVEPPSIADINNMEELRNVHQILLEANILILEGICNLEEVKQDYVTLMAMPLKIYKGDGAPVRALILEN
ncbi:cyclase family protein [Bacteroidota bacterium]